MGAAAILKLQKSGFTQDPVEALADFLDAQAVSKSDLKLTEAAVHTDIVSFRVGINTDITAFRAEVKSEFAAVRSEMREMEQRITIRLGGMMMLAVGVILAAFRHLPAPHP